MKIWAVSMVKDEADIIEHTIAHLDAQGVTGIVVADNLSTDGTHGILQSLKTDCELIVKRDTEVGYFQARKMTELAHFAFRLGAEWVIPFDADELWYSAGAGLVDTLSDLDADCALANLYNYFPSKRDLESEPNPFLRIIHRDRNPAPLPKVAIRRRPDVVIAQGNHNAMGEGDFQRRESRLAVAHFPWRSYEQYERKIRNGATAYAHTNLPEDVGAHWRQHGAILNREGPRALRTVFETHFVDPDLSLVRLPAPWAGTEAAKP